MVVVHLVLLSFKPDASADAVAACLRELRLLATSVPGVLQLSCGQNFTSRGREFTHALTVHLEDKAALDAYAVHPGSYALRHRAPRRPIGWPLRLWRATRAATESAVSALPKDAAAVPARSHRTRPLFLPRRHYFCSAPPRGE